MDNAVLIALISGFTAISSGVIAGVTASKLTIYRIEQLEKKVDKHNCLVERMVKVEARAEQAHERINELREEVTA